MKRAALERSRTLREWRRRLPMDADLEPGRFRKRRTVHGCPGRCSHCRALKTTPARQQRVADIV